MNNRRKSSSKFYLRLLSHLNGGRHSHMLSYSNVEKTEFKVRFVNMKSKCWSEMDISLFKDLDDSFNRQRSMAKYEQDVKIRFKSNMSKCGKYIKEKYEEKGPKGVTVKIYEILARSASAENRKVSKEFIKENKKKRKNNVKKGDKNTSMENQKMVDFTVNSVGYDQQISTLSNKMDLIILEGSQLQDTLVSSLKLEEYSSYEWVDKEICIENNVDFTVDSVGYDQQISTLSNKMDLINLEGSQLQDTLVSSLKLEEYSSYEWAHKEICIENNIDFFYENVQWPLENQTIFFP